MMNLIMPALLLLSGTPDPPSTKELLSAAAEAEAAQEQLRSRYVYKERRTNWDLDEQGRRKSGEPRSAVYEHIFLEGAPFRQMVERNGKPLSEAEKTRQAQARQAEAKRRRDARRTKRFLPGTRSVELGKLNELWEHCETRVEGTAELDGQPVWVVEVAPRAGRTGKRGEPGGEISAYRQTLWIHRDEKVVVRRLATVVSGESEILMGSVLDFRFQRPAGQEVWFPSKSELTFRAKNYGMLTYRGFQEHEFWGFQKFDVESTITVVEEP